MPLVYIATMKVVIAPDSFKESLSAAEVAAALAAGLRRVLPGLEIIEVPMADGGEGTLQAMAASARVSLQAVEVRDALGQPISARYGALDAGHRALIEIAEIIGLDKIPAARRSPLQTSSFGVGQMIRACLERGARHLVVGLGGSATVDGGAGMLQALGVRFLDGDGVAITAPLTGGSLADIARLDLRDLDQRLRHTRIDIASDVDNPLCGPRGAAAVFGPQKGASAAEVVTLDRNLRDLYTLLEQSCGREVAERAGAGAAGGLGAALLLVLNGHLRPGVEVVMEAVGLRHHLHGANLVVTGEGRVDAQTLFGKAPAGVARLAHDMGIPVVAVGGSMQSTAALWESGLFDALEAAVTEPCAVADALRDARSNVTQAGIRLGLWLTLLSKLNPLP